MLKLLLTTMQPCPVSEVENAVIQHNQLRDIFTEACCHAHFQVRIEMGSGLTPDHSHSHLDC